MTLRNSIVLRSRMFVEQSFYSQMDSEANRKNDQKVEIETVTLDHPQLFVK